MKETTISVIDYRREIVQKDFIPFKTELEKFQDSCLAIQVDSKDKMAIAKSNIKLVNNLRASVKELYDDKKKPLSEYIAVLDEYKNEAYKIADDVVAVLKSRIASYQELEKAAAKLEAEAKRKELEEKAEKVEKDRSEIIRLAGKINSLIFGGRYFNPDGSEQYAPGCHTISALKDMRIIIQEKLPKKERFVSEVQDYYMDIINNSITTIDNQINDLQTKKISGESPVVDQNAALESYAKIHSTLNEMQVKSDKILKKEEKQIENTVKEAGKGLSASFEFSPVDFDKIDKRFLQINEQAVREYLQFNRETVLHMLETGVSNYEILAGFHITAVNKVIVR